MKENLIYLFTFAVMAILTAALPFIGRKDRLFGVPVSLDLYHDSKVSANRYAFSITIFLVTFVAASYITRTTLAQWGFLMITLFVLAAYVIVYFIYHKRVQDAKKKESWAEPSTPNAFTPSLLPYYMVYSLLFIATAVLIGSLYPQMPQQIPMNFDFFGNVTRFAEKTPGVMILLLLTQLLMVMIFTVSHLALLKPRQKLYYQKYAQDAPAILLLTAKYWGKFTLIAGVGTMGIFAFLALCFAEPLFAKLILPYAMLMLITLPLFAIYTAKKCQKDSLVLLKDEQSRATYLAEEKHWKLGLLYSNKENPHLFVKQRFGMGYTVNLADPKAPWLLCAFLALLFGILIFSFLATQ